MAETIIPMSVGVTEETVFKVYRTLRRIGLDEGLAMRVIQDLQAQGILFREWLERPEDIIPWKHKLGMRSREFSDSGKFVCDRCGTHIEAGSFEEGERALNQHIRESHRNLEEAP